MRIGLFGYGKMGKMIEMLAQERGHTIAARIDVDTKEVKFDDMDVAIDFSTPDSAFANISACMEHGIPVICGTTGWLNEYDRAVSICEEKGELLYMRRISVWA